MYITMKYMSKVGMYPNPLITSQVDQVFVTVWSANEYDMQYVYRYWYRHSTISCLQHQNRHSNINHSGAITGTLATA